MLLLSEAQSLGAELTALKADFHRHPELSFCEKRTTAILKEKLVALGLELVELGLETGVVALLRGGQAGRTVALRADIDAIAQQEPEGEGASEVPGVMHACGHDFHTACLYGAAKLLCARRAELAGDVVFLFQCAEETTQGAAAMVARGLWEKLPRRPDRLFGLHNRPQIPCGQVAVMEGAVMSGKCHFAVTLHGVAGHGGAPHACVDVFVPCAALINGIQSIVSKNTNPLDCLVCAVCSVHAGTAENFVPDVLTMTGSIRAHSTAVMNRAKERLAALTAGVCAAYGCTYEIKLIPQVPPTVNSLEMTAIARRAAEAVVGAGNITAPQPDMGSEDFSVLGQDIPSFFYWLGSGFPSQENAGWHNEHFRTNDAALPVGAALLAQSALEGLA